jgi:hypothetical protein
MPPEQLKYVNEPPENAYEAPDVFNPYVHPPKGEIDVLSIVEAGPDYRPIMAPSYLDRYDSSTPGLTTMTQEPGKGTYLETKCGYCDGSLDSFCGHCTGSTCLLYGHNDGRHGFHIDSKSGWLVLNVPKVKHGFIVVKLETWHFFDENPKTKLWKTINNETINNEGGRRRSLESNATTSNRADTEREGRQLGKRAQELYCDDFHFEISIDGKITSYNKAEFRGDNGLGEFKGNNGKVKHMQRVVELVNIFDDPEYSGGKEKDIQVAIRMLGCKAFKMSHIYWS